MPRDSWDGGAGSCFVLVISLLARLSTPVTALGPLVGEGLRQIRRKARPLLLPSTPSSSKGALPDHSFHMSRSLAFRIPHPGPFITPVQSTGSCFQNRVAWSFSQRSPWPEHFHHHLPALGASGIFLTATDASREPLRVHCLQWHLAKATWMFFYFLRIHLTGSLMPSSFVQHLGNMAQSLSL